MKIFKNKIAFSLALFNEISFIIKCIIYFLMYLLSSEEKAINMGFG